jgi:hypothetical protein
VGDRRDAPYAMRRRTHMYTHPGHVPQAQAREAALDGGPLQEGAERLRIIYIYILGRDISAERLQKDYMHT